MRKIFLCFVFCFVFSGLGFSKDKIDIRSNETEGVVETALAGPMKDVEEIIYTIRGPGREWHFYGNFGYRCERPENFLYGGGPGQLAKLNIRTGDVVSLLQDDQGSMRDPDVHYSGEKILFSYRRGGTNFYHLYEINIDGSGLRQLTDGPWDDMDGIYLPNGEIMFCSSRGKRWVPCLDTQVAILYKCDADGKNIRRISANVETESSPAVLADGRVAFMRWEYVHRGVMNFHHLWTVNPDGTGQMTLFGNMLQTGYPGLRGDVLMTDPQSVPGTNLVSSIFCDKHGRSEYRGHLYLIDPGEGPDNPQSSWRVNQGFPGHPDPGFDIPTEAWRDPWPFSADCFMLASHQGIYIMNGRGEFELLYKPEWLQSKNHWIHEPVPLKPREREPIIPKRSDWSQETATLMLQDIYIGRNMEGVEKGSIKDLVILEVTPTPVHFGTGTDALGSVHNLRRIVGTVPVEPDGSAYFKVPPRRALVFVARDEKKREVKRMNSFVTLMPGEKTGCVGCHENRTSSPPAVASAMPVAMRKSPVEPRQIEGVPEIIDFNRDIQPILNKHCVKCHNSKNEKAASLEPGNSTMLSRSWEQIYRRWGVPLKGSNNAPYSTGSSGSRFIKVLEDGHKKVELSEREMNTFRMWITAGANYAGTYAGLTYDAINSMPIDRSVIEKRCYSCHAKKAKNPKRFEWPGGVRDYDLINLDNPETSRLLLMPLASEAGGMATAKAGEKGSKKAHPIVFKNREEDDFQTLKSNVMDAAEQIKDFGWYGTGQNWKPNPYYIREMKRYGVLPEDFDIENDAFDPFETDQKYLESIYNDSPYE